ncbi:MAG: hypothetical protein M8349_06510 [ANME-2 cluster archaeon]|nr:hypothetical protein [ANME-2 cluster archaeon]
MKKHPGFPKRTIFFSLLFFALLSHLVIPALALETESKIHAGEGVLGIGESYELYQGYSVKMIEPASSGGKIIMEITLDGKAVDEDIFIQEGKVYNFTRIHDDKDYLILAITLVSVDTDDLTATLKVTQYLDPSRSTSGFFFIDDHKTLEPGTPLPLKQDYSLNIEKLTSDSVTLALYKNGLIVKEQEMEKYDDFNYSVTANGKDHTIITFNMKSIIDGTTRSAVFIEHLYQFEEPIYSSPFVSIPVTGNGTGSTIAVSILATSSDGRSTIYENHSINVTYSISGNTSFESVNVTLDDNIIEESIDIQPGTYTIILEPLSTGNHIIEVSALSSEGILVSNETSIYVRKNYAANLANLNINLISAPIVFAGVSLLVIIWAAMRSRKHDKWD